MAYASEIDIKISETPKTSDPNLLPDLIDIYNALHILAQYTDQLRNFITKDPEGPPWETYPMDKVIHTKAHVAIKRGEVCGPAYVYKTNNNRRTISSFHGAILGVPYKMPIRDPLTGLSRPYNSLSPFVNGLYGIATEDTAAGDMVPIAIGPGVIEVPGLKTGESIFAWSAYTEHDTQGSGFIGYVTLRNNGSIFRLALTPTHYTDRHHMHRVGVGVAPDAMFVFPPPIESVFALDTGPGQNADFTTSQGGHTPG